MTVWKGALFPECVVSSSTGGDWLWVAEIEEIRDIFAKGAAAMTINCEAFGFSERPEVEGEREAGGRVGARLWAPAGCL